ncbi:MAG: replicative DNA helicase [Candidatus Marinimicrobia bacterium]|jgi:replicative DNA helicase|nr:replicative DNA helicase [Candidatus Neomarinimicrobiota bacterium]MDP6852595.1 replicative DNA helicase [Candidatus Neomarinimicrobiota bacterium]MDP6936000.1 replicative DNA helicase [Candidatus Neomarinimicrobiota bacterium]
MAEKKQPMRLPPQSVEAEEAVLGCMLIDPEAVPRVLHTLTEKSFYKTVHAHIFTAISALFEKNDTVDTISVSDALQKSGKLEEIGGAYFLTGLSSNAPSASNVEFYAKIVKEKEILRSIIQSAVQMSTEAYESQEETTNILDKAEQILFNLSQDANRGGFTVLEPVLHEVLDIWGSRKGGDLTGVPTGYYKLDDILSGLQASDLIICAGRPSMGKTALALSIARNAAVDYGHKVGLFSLEMSNRQLVERLITAEAKVDSHSVRTGRLPKKDWKNLSKAAGPISEAQIYIDDTAGLNIMELRARARQLKAEKDIELLVVDYIQLLYSGGRVESRQQEISFISRSLKALAKDLNIPILALSQLSRAPETRTDHRPIMSDLRESGAIEQDADVILFIYRKYVYSKNEEDRGLGEIIVAKHRNGPTGMVEVSFIDKYARFENLSRTEQDFIPEDLPA